MAQFYERSGLCMKLDDQRLIRISKATRDLIQGWREGVSLHKETGEEIDTLCLRVTVARWKLALQMRHAADQSVGGAATEIRTAISRYYYAMYHALRAAAYLSHRGDDHEEHRVLPQQLPQDFPSRSHWSNQLKSAREYRNRADYDPFPLRTSSWRRIAVRLRRDADVLLPLTKKYLKTKGCVIR
jgi:uncharacterized protein (UPF0332 family)